MSYYGREVRRCGCKLWLIPCFGKIRLESHYGSRDLERYRPVSEFGVKSNNSGHIVPKILRCPLDNIQSSVENLLSMAVGAGGGDNCPPNILLTKKI